MNTKEKDNINKKGSIGNGIRAAQDRNSGNNRNAFVESQQTRQLILENL